MIVDSSAVLAILFAEADANIFAQAIERAETCRISAANWLEAAIRIDQAGDSIAVNAFEDFFRISDIRIESVTPALARYARDAYRAYGKGTAHPAQLNFGDCFAYALAKLESDVLLYKGEDFSRTDIASALSPP